MDLQAQVEKWAHVLNYAGCPEGRREQISVYLENQPIKNTTDNVLLSNVILLSRLTIDDSSIIFSSQAKRIEKVVELEFDIDSLVVEVITLVVNKVLELTQEELHKSNTFRFSGNLIDRISIKTPNILEVVYNCYCN